MITYDPKSNIGFDLDVNIYPNDDDNEYSPKEIKQSLIKAFNKNIKKYGYSNVEDSTRVITIKIKILKTQKLFIAWILLLYITMKMMKVTSVKST